MNQDHYTRRYFNYRAKALCRARNASTNKVYSKYESIEVNSTIMVLLSHNKEIVKNIALTEINIQYSNRMKEKISSDLNLKRSIGGVSWTTDIIDLVIKIYKDHPLYIWEI